MTEFSMLTTMSVVFKINRLVYHQLQASSCDLTVDIEFADEGDDESKQDKLRRMRAWINTCLDGCVAFNVQSTLDTKLFGELENHIMFCPDEPHDHMLLTLITAKLNAIGEGLVWARSAMLHVDSSQGFGNSLIGDPLEILPSAEEWMGSLRYFDDPWWCRPDGGMMDVHMQEGDDPAAKPDILIDLSPARIIVREVDKSTDETASSDEHSAEIIRPDFRNKVKPK